MTLAVAKPRSVAAPQCRDCRYYTFNITGRKYARCKLKGAKEWGEYCSIIRDPRYDILARAHGQCGSWGVYFIPKRTIWQRIKNLWERDPQP